MHKNDFKKRGFTLVEILIVIVIIGLLSAVIVAATLSVRAKGRDTQVRIDKQQIILALVRARESNPDYKYPGTGSGFVCLKTSGTCFNGAYSADPAVVTTLSQYFSGGIVPQPPGTNAGERRHDAYVYAPGPISVGPGGGTTGSFLIWAQEKVIPDCNGHYAGVLSNEPGIYYCWEKLP